MRCVLRCAVAAFPLLTAAAFAPEGGSVFTNTPNKDDPAVPSSQAPAQRVGLLHFLQQHAGDPSQWGPNYGGCGKPVG
ncbi:MAG: hypothetical protein JOY71_04280 [Acetobacteraceae bacterium]|nr:hypothetical protein [Acetobacteraceae bacterium]